MCLGVGSGGRVTYEAGSEMSAVQICGVSGFDLAEFFFNINVLFIISGATFSVPGGSGRVLEGPRKVWEGPQGGPGGSLRGSWASL